MENGMTVIIIFLVIVVVLVLWYHFTDITKYEYICTNCGAKKTFYLPKKIPKNVRVAQNPI